MLYDTLIVFLKEFFEEKKMILKKLADDKKGGEIFPREVGKIFQGAKS